jgi:hypothetical protein
MCRHHMMTLARSDDMCMTCTWCATLLCDVTSSWCVAPDYRLLEEVARAEDVARRRRPPAPKRDLPPPLATLVSQARCRGVNLLLMSPGEQQQAQRVPCYWMAPACSIVTIVPEACRRLHRLAFRVNATGLGVEGIQWLSTLAALLPQLHRQCYSLCQHNLTCTTEQPNATAVHSPWLQACSGASPTPPGLTSTASA